MSFSAELHLKLTIAANSKPDLDNCFRAESGAQMGCLVGRKIENSMKGSLLYGMKKKSDVPMSSFP